MLHLAAQCHTNHVAPCCAVPYKLQTRGETYKLFFLYPEKTLPIKTSTDEKKIR